MLCLVALLFENVKVNDFCEMSVVHFVNLDGFSRDLLWNELIVLVHEAIDHYLVVLENYSSNYTIWRDPDGLERFVIPSVIVHDLNNSGCFLSFWVMDILLYLACSIPDSATT